MLNTFNWCQKQFNRAYNYVWTSRPWFYTWELKNKLGATYIQWLMQHNGIKINPDNPMWPYLLGELSEQAMHSQGIARRDLYLFNTSLNILGFHVPLKLRGFTLMSVVADTKTRINFCDAPARAAFDTPAGLVGLPNFVNVPWSQSSREEKTLLKGFINKNQDRLWWAALDYCQHLEDHWSDDYSAAQNLTLMTLNLIARASFGLDDLPDDMYKLVETFEDLWQHPEAFSAARFNQNIQAFKEITQQLKLERKSDMPLLETNFKEDFYNFHKDKTFLKGPEDLNIASFLAIFGNLPKAIIGMVFTVLAKPEHLDNILKEKERIKLILEEKGIQLHSGEAFDYILHHSEVFQRYYYEVLRLWFIAPVVPRLNTNLLFNQLGRWGESTQISDEHDLPPRSFAIFPQRLMALDENHWENAETFNPYRKEYEFKINQTGKVISTGQKPLVFGEEGSKRVCPGREYSRKIFMAIMWSFSDNHHFSLTQEDELEMSRPQDPYQHHQPLEPSRNKPIQGVLTQFKAVKARFQAPDEQAQADISNLRLPQKKISTSASSSV